MSTCPYCKSPLRGEMAIPPLNNRQQIIYNAVVGAGRDGIRTTDLVSKIDSNGPGAGIVLRVQVHEINRLLTAVGQRIKGHGGSYWLIETPVSTPKPKKIYKPKKKT